MNSKEHRKDFNRRWNILLQPDSPPVAFQKFKQRILNVFQDIDQMVTKDSGANFCQYYGIKPKLKKNLYSRRSQFHRIPITIIDYLAGENDIKEFYKLIEMILSLQFFTPGQKLFIIQQVKQAVEMSDLNVAVGKSKGRIILYPEGDRKLDNELVNKTLLFLDPESNKHFENALRFYQKKQHKESAERLRQSVEEFFRYKLQNKKGLPENIKTLQQKLKNNSQSQIRNIIFQIFSYLDEYFNKHSKHGDNVNEVENEFLIYQTGLLLRYINKTVSQTEQQLKKQEG